jgi:hypothetical protein
VKWDKDENLNTSTHRGRAGSRRCIIGFREIVSADVVWYADVIRPDDIRADGIKVILRRLKREKSAGGEVCGEIGVQRVHGTQ